MSSLITDMNEDESTIGPTEYELLESGFMVEFPYAIVKSIRNKMFEELLATSMLPSEWLCGYIGVPESHPWFDQDRAEIDSGIDISYKGNNPDYPIPTTVPICWIGFDTAHYGFIRNKTHMDVNLARQLVERMAAKASEHYRKEPDEKDDIDDILSTRRAQGDENGG